MSEGGYLELQVISDWTTRIELGGKPLDFDKYYDVKTKAGHSFEGCRVYSDVSHYQGMGGMDESHTTITPFFEAQGLEMKLKSGYLMRVNEDVTGMKKAEKKLERKRAELEELYKQRDEANEKISELEANFYRR